MKKIWILIFFSVFASNLEVYSQELKAMKKMNFKDTDYYFINKKTKELCGEFLKINDKGDTLIKGNYSNNKKTGLWSYKCKTGYFKFDYNRKELHRNQCAFFTHDSFTVNLGNQYFLTKVDIPAIYLGYENELKDIIAFNFRIPASVMENNLSGYAIASINIDTCGKISGVNIEKPFDKTFDKALKKFLEKEINGDFLPTIYNNSIVESKLFIVVDISSSPRQYYIDDNSYQIYVPLFYSSFNFKSISPSK
ncbi:MAG: hypothetical protein AB7S48_08560 [Bacteroidales bacterium]